MRIFRLAALAVTAVISMAASPPSPNWLTKATVTATGSHQVGNPAAKVKLVEYVSYTCSHCAHFQKESEAPLRLAYVMPGKVSLEVRHLVRDPIDLTVAMLTNCVAPNRFFAVHNLFLQRQEAWIKPLYAATQAQKQRWTSGDMPTRLRAIARDFGFYAIMAQQGVPQAAADRCLANKAMADRLSAQTAEAQKLGVAGTPSFLLDGILLSGTYDWAGLQPQLDARL